MRNLSLIKTCFYRWLIRLIISDTNCLLLISVKWEKKRSIYNCQWEKKKRKRKYIIVMANPIVSLIWKYSSLFFSRTYRTNQQLKWLRRKISIILMSFFIEYQRTLSKYFEYSCKNLSRPSNRHFLLVNKKEYVYWTSFRLFLRVNVTLSMSTLIFWWQWREPLKDIVDKTTKAMNNRL
jgi:hypothetical protein